MDIKDRIKARRKQLGLSYEKLAARIFELGGKKLSWQTVAAWEKRDKTGTAPNRNNIGAAAKGLQCSVDWLNTGYGNADDPPDLPKPEVTPDMPAVAKMVLQYCTPEENELLEQFRLSYERGRTEIKLVAKKTEKRPLGLVTGSDKFQE